MATEADFPEAISVTKGEGDRYLTSEQFDRNVEQCSPLELHKSKGELDQHHEIEKPFADSENVKVDCSTQVESKNNSFGISEGEHFLAPLSEISQADQSNQAAMEIAKTEDAKLQVERVEASKSETTVDQHVQAVISYQQDSTKENLQRLENEAETSEVDVKGTEKADGNAESYRKEASGLLEATTFQEYEGSISTIDLTNNSLKKDIEMETNVDNTSSINPIFQEEFKEETSTKVTSNIEYDSQQTMHKYEQEEEIQKFPEVMPENAKTELASENAEVITCTDEERAIQNAKEYSEKEEANPVHIAEKEFEATRTEQVTGEHALLEIHTAEDHPQEFDEENSTYFQARVEAANFCANTVEKNSEEEVIQEKCSSLVEEQTTEKISREEEIHVTDLKKEEKETDARDEEPIEVADTTREIEFETIEQRTETNKDLYAPIPEEEAYAEESTKAFVQNATFLSEVSEIKTKEIIQEDLPTVSNYGLVSGEVSHVSGSKEAETENKEHVEILTDATALETEDHAQAEESFNSKENMEKEIQTAEDEGKRDVKETSIVLEEEGLVTILTDQTALQTEDAELQAEENVDSKDISEKQISTVADEGENGLMEARAENNEKGTHTDITTEEKGIATTVTDESDTGLKEAEEANKEQVKISDISPEEKVLPTILTDETTLDIEDIDVQAEKNSNSIENVEKQIPVIADEGLKEAEEENKEQVKINDNSPEEILTDEAAVDNEEIELQAEENVNSKDNSEKQIPTVADEGEIYLAKAEAENNEQVTITDTTPEEKGLATISTDEKALDTEDIDVQAEESFHSEEKLEELIPTTEVRNTEISPEEKDLVTILANETSLDIQHPAVQAEETSNSKENLEKQISEAPDKGDTCVKEAGEENKEQVKNTDISPEEKGQETIIIDETTQNKEYIAVQAGENFISKEILEIPKAVDEDKTDLMEAEAESNEHVSTTEIGPEEKGLATILTDETAEDIEYNDAQAAEINSKEVLEKQIPTVVDEGETDLTEAEAECKEHVEYTGIAPEQKSVETILRDEPALNLEDVEQEQENFNSKENLENQIPTAVDEGEADLNRGEAENNEQVKNSDITVLRDETAMDIEDLQEKENQIPKEASEGEEKVGHGDIVFDHTPVNVYSTELVGDNTVEESFQVQSHEEAEQKLGVKDEKSEDHPERNDMIVEEVLEEPKITSRDFKEEQIIGGNVTIFTPESIEEDTVKNSQDNEKEENANDLSPEYIPEDGSEKFKDDKNDAVQSEGEILEHSQNVGVEESTTCETKNVKKSEEILSTLPVKYDQESSPAPKDNDGDNGAVTVTETCAKAPSNDEEDSPQVLKYEPGEEITKLPDVLPEETIPESSNEIAEVITCTKEEIQESLHKESDPSTEEACNEAAELSTEGEKEKQTTQEVSSSLIGEETTEESSKEDENFVTSLQEEKNEEHEVCKEAIEAKSETIEDTTEPKPISEEESNKSLVEDNSFMSEASEKEIEKEIQSKCSCTVRNFDSEVVSDKTGLSEATTENKEQVETTHITPEEKDNAGTGVYNTELVGETIVEPNFQLQPLEEVLDEPKITDRDFNEEQITEGNVVNFATESIVEETVTNYQDDEKETEKLNEEGSSIENIKEGNADDISTECVPEDRGEKLEECIGEAVESKEEILQESQTDGSGEITTRDTTDADKTEEETTLQNDEPREVKVSNLALEKLDSDATEEETTGGSEVVSESNSKSIDVVTKDEVISDQTLNEGISKESSTLLSEEKELRASEHELETTSQDKNIEEEHAKEVEVPTANDTGDLLAPRSAEETCLPKEEPRELKVSELALEKIEAGESDEEIKETFETVSKFDSQSIGVVSESEILEHTQTTTCEIQNVERYEEIVSTLPVKYDQGSSPAPTEASKEENTFSVQEAKDNIDGDNGAVTVSETCAKKNEEHEVCKEAIEAKSETLVDTTEPKSISEEESNKSLVEDNSFMSEASEKEIEKEIQSECSCTVRSFDSEVVSDETGLSKATAENKEQVETTHISPEEKDNAGTGVYNTELVGETIVEPSFQVQPLEEEEAEPKLEVEDGTDKSDDHPEKNSKILEEVLDEPKITDRDFNEEQITEGNVVNFATESIVEETITNYQDDEKETEKLNEEGSSIENIKEGNANDISTECVPEDRGEKLEECIGEAVESKEEILQESQTDGSGEITTRDTTDADKTEEETTLQNDEPREVKVSNLALEKLDSDATEEETTGGSEVVLESDSKSIDVVTKDEVIADQTPYEGISKERSTLLAEEKELRASEHELETTSQDKNIEEEHAKEVEVPTANDTGDLLAPRSAEETCLPKEEPRELKVSELALEKIEAGESEEEIKETFETVSKFDSQSIGAVSESETTTCEIQNVERYEEIVSTLPVKYDQESSPAPTEALKEENTFSVQEAKVKIDGDNGAVTVSETCAKVTSNDAEDSPQVFKYEPGEEITKFPDVLPEESIQESSREKAEVITCTKEEIQESLDKESDTSTGEVLETISTETGEQALLEVNHPQGFNDKETTESNTTEYQACNEADELSTEVEKEKQITQEVSSSRIGKETTEECSKEKEQFVTSLQEETNEEHEVCKEAIEAKSETLEDTTEPKPISEEENNKSIVEDNSFLSEASEIQGEYSSTVPKFDSGVVSDKTGLTEATVQKKEQVETTHIVPEEKDNAGTGVYNAELVGETIVEPSFQVQPLEEEAEPKLEVEDETDKSDGPEKNNKILEEVSFWNALKQILDEPKISDRDFNEEQITEGNVVNFATESIVEETVTNYQDDEKETEKLNEEGSSIENIKEGNANDISTECVPEDRGEKLEECIGEAVESKEEILQESQTDGSGEITTRDTTDADKTEEETTLQNDEPREVKVSNLALEKLDSDATEEETTGGSEVVPESDSKSIDVVTKDEVIADQTLYEGISKERSTLLAEEKELRASEHELETTSQDKNIEEEHAKEVEVPTANDTGDLLAPRSAEETCLPKEEPKELKVSELALEKIEAGESEEEIKETFETVSKFDSQSIGVVSESETTTCEIQNVEIYEEIVSTLPVKYDQGSSPAPTEALKEENTFSVQESKDNIDGDNGAVTVSETCAKVTSNDAEDSPQVFKYEPGEEITKLPDVLPEESIQESSREKAEVITCTKEEIQESLDKESDTSTGEACNDAAELSTEGEKEKQTTQEVSSSMIGKETTEESSKEKEQFVTSLQEETNEEHEVCKEAIEAKSETLEDTTEPKPISEEESNKSIVEDNSFLSEASEIQGEYCSTVRNFDSGVVSDKTGLTEATAQKKEQVETTHIVPEEKDNAGTDVYNDELVGETIVEPSFQVQPLEEEAEPKLEVEDETDKSDGAEKNNKILEEVLDEPKISDRDFNEEQITEGNVVNFATESIVEETVSDYQDDEKETEKLNEEGSSIETIKEGNANDISTECVPEDRDEKLEECIGEAVESKEENLQESQTNGLGENTTCDTSGAEMADSDAPEEETTGDSEVVPESDSKSIDVVTKDEIIADQTLDEEISKEPCTLLAEEKELRASEHEHGTTSQDKNIEEEHAKEVEVPTANDTGDSFAPRSVEETCLPKEEPIEKVSEFVLEMREAGENEEEIKETFETVSKFDSQSIGVVSEDEIITDQTQCEGNIDAPLQIPSYTLLTEEKYVKASEVVQETLDADTPEEEIKDGSAMVPKFDSESTDEVLKDVVISDQTLQEGLSTEQLQKPSSALLPEEKELRASEHEHDTTTVDKNLDEENPKEVEVPADEDKQDLYAATPAKEICLQADEPKDFELALQNLDAGELEEEIKGTFETVSKSDSQNIVVASGDDILADQTLCEGIADPPLSKDREFGATELALEKVDAEDNEEIKVPEIVTKFDSKSIEIVSNNEVIADQTFNEGITKEQIQSPSSTLLPEEKEREASEPEHETTAQDKNTEQECTKVEVSADEDTQALFAAGPVEEKSLQKEEPSEVNVSELAQEKLHAGDTEEANETFETVSKPDFPSTVAVSNEEITVDETLSKGVADIPLEIPSYTSLHKEKELKAFELDLEKQDADIPEEEIKEVSEVIPQSNSQSTYEVSKDEIIADQLQIPSSALVPDEKEFKASEHEYETTTDDKNIEDENLKEVEEPTDEATQDLFAARSTVESCLQKEKSSELKVPEVAPEKLDADETEEVKETFETVSKSDSESIYAVSKDELTDDQTLCDVITDMPLHIPSYTSLTKENELNPSELALEKLDANATEEVKGGSEVTPKSDLQSIDVVVKDEIIADQVLHEVITKDQLHIQSSILLPEEKELKESEHEHGTATQYKNLEKEYAEEIDVTADEDPRDLFVASSEEKTQLQKEEPRELKVSELAPEILNVDETEEVTENCERVSKTDPESTDAVSKDESVAERTLHQSDEQLQIASPTLLPKEKEEATVQKEEPEDCRVKELGLKELDAGETEEETKEAFETVPEFSSQSIGGLATDEIVDQIPPSSLLTAEKRCENTTTIDNAEEKSMSVVETPNDESRKDTNIAEETSIPNEEPREINLFDLEFHSSQDKQRDSSHEVHEEEGCSLKEVPKVEPREDEEEEIFVDSNETKKNEASNEERNLEVATSDSRAEDWCETTIAANETAKIEVPNEEIKDEKEVVKDSQLIYVGEENIRASQQENESREEKYPEEKNETFNTAPSENHHEVTNPMEKDSGVEISQEGILGSEEACRNTRDIKQLEKESHATNIPSSNEAALNFLQDPTLEGTKPSNDTLVATETKEEKVSESGVETADSTSAQISERLMNESTKERMKVITHLTEEKEPTVCKELQADKEEEDEEEHENVKEAKTDEEKEDTEHKRTYQGYDEPVIVEASTDTEVKVKKSHNILSGMGSKVKHSISKVKKAIIGKSSNSKTQSEK